MAIDEVDGQAWTRKHDEPHTPVVPHAPRTLYPTTLPDLVKICSNRRPSERIRAAGSHWALSEAAISDSVFVETHDPNDVHPAMDRTLYEVVPNCLTQEFIDALARVQVPEFNTDPKKAGENQGFYPVHIETGKRVYQLYWELDFEQGDDHKGSLAKLLESRGNSSYLRPWAFATLGGAGGQTVFGALTTGTHGGDFRMPPIADAVIALHLVADGGKQYWIEPESLPVEGARLTDDVKLTNLYRGIGDFEIIRNDQVFNAVLVSVGRFGIVYSIVIAAVAQYCLHQERRLTTWQEIKNQIANPASGLYTEPKQKKPPSLPNRFLQVAVSLTPHANFSQNLAGVSKRWNVPLAPRPEPGSLVPAGRLERRGEVTRDPATQELHFDRASPSFSYDPDPDHPGLAAGPNFLERACSNADFLDGVIAATIDEVKTFVDSHGTVLGAGVAAIVATGGGATLAAAASAFLPLLALLAAIWAALKARGDTRFGEVMNDVRKGLLSNADPASRMAGVFIWQVLVFKAFSSQQAEGDFDAVSYAVMDAHDYEDRSCTVNVDSIEVFFDATDPMLIAFVDALIAFETTQELILRLAFVGYASLRFTGRTRALIGPQRFPMTCAVEVAGLKDVDGSTQLIDYAIALALSDNYKGILHWGQRNPSERTHIEERFGAGPSGSLHDWRQALSRITDNGARRVNQSQDERDLRSSRVPF